MNDQYDVRYYRKFLERLSEAIQMGKEHVVMSPFSDFGAVQLDRGRTLGMIESKRIADEVFNELFED